SFSCCYFGHNPLTVDLLSSHSLAVYACALIRWSHFQIDIDCIALCRLHGCAPRGALGGSVFKDCLPVLLVQTAVFSYMLLNSVTILGKVRFFKSSNCTARRSCRATIEGGLQPATLTD